MAKFKCIALFSVLSFGMMLNSLAMYDYVGSFFGRETDEEICNVVQEIIDNSSTTKDEFCKKLQSQQDTIIDQLKRYASQSFESRGDVLTTLLNRCYRLDHDKSLGHEIIDYFKNRCKELGLENKINIINVGWAPDFIDIDSHYRKVMISKICLWIFSKHEIFALIDHELTHLQRADTHMYWNIYNKIPSQANDVDQEDIDQLLEQLIRINETIADQFPALEKIEKAQSQRSALLKYIVWDILTLPLSGYRSLRGFGTHPSTVKRYLDACRIIRYLTIEKQLHEEQKKTE